MLRGVYGHECLYPRLQPLIETVGGTSLFHGPPSVGKRTVAFEVARQLMCLGNCTEASPCKSCQRFETGHPDFKCIGRYERAKVDDVDDVLNFITTAPFISKTKVVVIDNADTLTYEAANRLLKTLEEPPSRVTFFLVSSNPGMILKTIMSRCIGYEFGALLPDDVINILWKKIGFDLPQSRIIGWLAAGSPVDVFARAGSYLKCRNLAYDLLSTIKGRSLIDCFDFIDKVDRNDLPIFIDMMVTMLTDLLFLQNKIDTIVNTDLKENLQVLSGNFKDRALILIVSVFGQVKRDSILNVNLNMALKNALIRTHAGFAI